MSRTAVSEKTLRDLYGLKYNPFEADLPAEALWEPPQAEPFFSRMQMLARLGGFGLLVGAPGTGKSKLLQLLAQRLNQQADVIVGVMERPQSRLMDLYRELGQLFAVELSPSNRYGGFQALRTRWRSHIKSTLVRPVLLIDEAQETPTDCLNELRILGSAEFDSQCILTTVLCGDNRLSERLKGIDLLPLHSRIRAHLTLEVLDREALLAYLSQALNQAGAPHLMTSGLLAALAEQSEGNLRRLNQVAAQLLWTAVDRKLPKLDENLYLDLCSPGGTHVRPRTRRTP